MMNWIVITAFILIILYFIGKLTGGSSSSKSKAITVKSFIEDKKVYTEEEAVETIADFLKALGHKDYEHASKQFPLLIKQVKSSYRAEIKSWKKEITGNEEHFKKQPFDDEEDRKVFMDGDKEEIQTYNKAIRWFEKQIASLEDDVGPAMKKIMNECKREDNSSIHLMDHVITKELPDSYF